MTATQGPAYPRQTHEIVLVEGGVGFHALKMIGVFLLSAVCVVGGAAIAKHKDWRWGLGIMAFFGFGVVISLVQLLRVGRFQLTTQRLVWRPIFGKGSREALLSSLDLSSLEVDADSGLIKIGVRGGKQIAMGCVERFQELWGAILLWHELAAQAVDAVGAPVSGAVATWPCSRVVRGALPVPGTAVARPGYLAFVPDTFVVRRSTAQLAAEVATGLGLAIVGAGVKRTAAQPPILPTELAQSAADLVRATAHGKHAVESEDEALIADIDLSILGRDPIRFMEFEYGVAEEYAAMPSFMFRRGRARFLARILDGPIFRTPAFRERFEAAARANIGALLASPRYRFWRWLDRLF